MQLTEKVVQVRVIKKDGNYLISKSLELNEAKMTKFTRQELRFLEIYLGLIDPRKPETKIQSFTLKNFQEIMGLEQTVQPEHIKDAFDGLRHKDITVKRDDGGFEAFPLFCETILCKSEDGEWAVEIVAYKKAMPLIFKLQEDWQYIKYSMWNTLKLKSKNQMRLYCWAKQHQWHTNRYNGYTISVTELREILELSDEDYPEYKIFKRDVLDCSIKAINTLTDIEITYEIAKKGARGRILELRFTVRDNPVQKDQINDDIEINPLPVPEIQKIDQIPETPESAKEPEEIAIYKKITEENFTEEQLELIRTLIIAAFPRLVSMEMRSAHLQYWYNELKIRDRVENIRSTFNYLKSLVSEPVPGTPEDQEKKAAQQNRNKKNATHIDNFES